MSLYSAAIYNSTLLETTAAPGSLIYKRDASMSLNASIDTATSLGPLTYNTTQLDVTGRLSRENPAHFYKFALDGDNIKLSFVNNTSSAALRIQVLNSSGKVIADNSSSASETLQDAYKTMHSDDGYDAKAGDYYVKVTFDTTTLRSTPQTYAFSLYSGSHFSASYVTTVKSQTSTKQTVLVDNTMTYSLIDARAYEAKSTHIANPKISDAVNVGWLFENKAALSVTSQLTSVCSSQYYLFTLQKGETIKMAYNNKTATSETRVQILDSSGIHVMADSHGTKAQKEAYAALTSSEGLAAKPTRQYLVKVSYVSGEPKTKQIYELKLYAGNSYSALYRTMVGTESAEIALANGHFLPSYSVQSAAASYMTMLSQGEELNIVDAISKTI